VQVGIVDSAIELYRFLFITPYITSQARYAPE
jgi:hypothetical protein